MTNHAHQRNVVVQEKPKIKEPKKVVLVGAGNIARTHLAGYRWAGIDVVGIYDRDTSKAVNLARDFQIEFVATSLQELLERKDADIVDLNFPGNGKLDAIKQIGSAGKPVLVQKPLADDYYNAKAMVDVCRDCNIPMAVNMNARFNPQYQTVRNLVDSGALGELYHVFHHLASNHDGMPHHAAWLTEPARYQIIQFGIHHLDQVALWFGRQPRAVTAVNSYKPMQQFNGEMLATLALDFGESAGASILEMNALHRSRPYDACFELNGTEGALVGTWDGQITLYRDDLPPEGAVLEPVGQWFPNAFGCVMADFINSLSEGREPEVSGRANLKLLKTIEGCYRSLEEKRTIGDAEFLSEGTV